MSCLQYTSVIDENEQYYIADVMGPEIISVIERYLGHQFPEHALLCSNCWTHAEEIIGMEQKVVQEFEIQPQVHQ